MARYAAEAILLSARNWGEADRMLQFFSREHGKITAAAFGCRRPKSPLAGGLQLFHVLELSLVSGERVDTVRQCSLRRRFPHLEADLFAMAYASLIAEVLLGLMPEGAPQPEVYDWLPGVLEACGPRHPRLVALAAALQLLAFAGVGLSLSACAASGAPVEGDAFFSLSEGGALSPAAAEGVADRRPYPAPVRALLSTLSAVDWSDPPSFRARRGDIEAGEAILLSYLASLFGRPLRSLRFIRQLGGAP